MIRFEFIQRSVLTKEQRLDILKIMLQILTDTNKKFVTELKVNDTHAYTPQGQVIYFSYMSYMCTILTNDAQIHKYLEDNDINYSNTTRDRLFNDFRLDEAALIVDPTVMITNIFLYDEYNTNFNNYTSRFNPIEWRIATVKQAINLIQNET